MAYYSHQMTSLGNKTNSTDLYFDCLYEDAFDPACDYMYPFEPFKLTAANVLSAIGIAILIAATLAGNILVCVAFCHYKRLRTVPNYFIISLAVSDIMVAAFSMPLWLSYEVTGWQSLPAWVDFLVLQKFWECVDIVSAVSSIANLTAISLDRLFSIIAPLRHRTRMTPVMALIMISVAWSYSIILALCWITDYVDYTIIISCFGFFLPLTVIIASYVGIYIKYWIRSNKQGNINSDWNLEKTLLIVIGLFVSCWLPFFITTLLYQYCLSCKFDEVTVRHVRGFTKWMHYLNSCCNPIVYGFCNINFKTAFWALLGNCFTRRYSDMDLAPSSRETSHSQAGTILRHLKSIKRKLSWKRDVEESIVSNGGEVNDNSISLAILALQLKNGQNVKNQEAQALLEQSDSRPSSKASEDFGLLSDEQSSLQESSGDEIVLTKEIDVHSSSRESSTCEFRPREFTNMTYSSMPKYIREDAVRNLCSVRPNNVSIEFSRSSFEDDPKSKIQNDAETKLLCNKSRLEFINRINYSAEDTESLIENVQVENSAADLDYSVIRDTSQGCENHLSVELNPERRRRSGRFALDSLPANGIGFLIENSGNLDLSNDENLFCEENIKDTKESIV